MNYYKAIKYEVGQVVYLVPRDKRERPYFAEVVKVGRKYAYVKYFDGERSFGRDIKIEIEYNRTYLDIGSGDDVFETKAIYEQSVKDMVFQKEIMKKLNSFIIETKKLEAIAELLGVKREE